MAGESPKVVFIMRRPCEFVSIERVFGRIAKGLNAEGVATSTQTLPFGSGPLGILLNLLFFRPAPADIYHVTGHVHFMVLRLPAKKTVLTIHDLRFLKFRSGMRGWLIRKLFLDLPVRRAGRITVVSESTRRDLVAASGLEPGRIACIENPLGEEFLAPTSPVRGSDAAVILHIGTMENKNLETLVRALRGSDYILRVVGRLSPGQTQLLVDSNIRFLNDVRLSGEEMLEAYRNASILSFCSSSEGFGLPIIEANAVGLPVVTSNLKPMSDVARDAALLVDPHNPDEIRLAIDRLAGDPDLRGTLRERGYENAKRFAPGIIAGRYLSLYREFWKAVAEDE